MSARGTGWGRFGLRSPVAFGWALLAVLLCARPTVSVTAGPDASGETRAEFEKRLARIDPQDLAGRLELARWAESKSLLDEADETYRLVLRHDPLHEDAYEALAALEDKRTLQRRSDAYEATRRALPARFIEYETRRFVVLSDADVQWSRDQASRLERTYHEFTRFCRRTGLRPLPLKHKLVCVLFDARDHYLAFAQREDNVHQHWIAGYYAPQSDRTVFYHVASSPSITEADRRLNELDQELRSLKTQAKQAAQRGRTEEAALLRDTVRQYESHLEQERHRVARFMEQVSLATTLHEAVHQLSFHMRIQSPYVQYPIWVSEGLATAFETDEPRYAFGPDHEYEPRREPFLQMLRDDELIDLRALVQLSRMPDDRDKTIRTVYHQSYALLTWMFRARRNELRAYLHLMMQEPPGQPSPRRHLELFEQAFGPVERVEAAWLRYERGRSD